MRTHPRDVRCKGCNILLARIDSNGLTIRRGDLQATVTGDLHASFVCYRPRCGLLNVLRLSADGTATPA